MQCHKDMSLKIKPQA